MRNKERLKLVIVDMKKTRKTILTARVGGGLDVGC